MRLFVGVAIDAQTAAALDAFTAELRRRAAAKAPRARVTWVRREQLHITIRFIGEVDDDRARLVADRLAPPLEVPSFEAAVAGAGTFPERGAPRVFWAGITSGAGSLGAIEREVTARLSACGIDPEERPYRPHVTLGRVKEASGLRAAALLDGLAGRTFGEWRVDAITLFQSRPSPKGHTYAALQRTPLARRT